MNFFKRIGRTFAPRTDFVPVFVRQADFLCQSTDALVAMVEADDPVERRRQERVTKTCEVQGDAVLADFREMLKGRMIASLSKLDLQQVAMSMDDCLDVTKDAAKAIHIYNPAKIDAQLRDLAQLIRREAEALRGLMPLLKDVKANFQKLMLHCDQVKELEHAADDTYEEYIGYIFEKEPDLREMTKYKNLAELFEKVTDMEKKVADDVRKLVIKHNS